MRTLHIALCRVSSDVNLNQSWRQLSRRTSYLSQQQLSSSPSGGNRSLKQTQGLWQLGHAGPHSGVLCHCSIPHHVAAAAREQLSQPWRRHSFNSLQALVSLPDRGPPVILRSILMFGETVNLNIRCTNTSPACKAQSSKEQLAHLIVVAILRGKLELPSSVHRNTI